MVFKFRGARWEALWLVGGGLKQEGHDKKKKRFENTLIVKYTYVRQQEIMTMQWVSDEVLIDIKW